MSLTKRVLNWLRGASLARVSRACPRTDLECEVCGEIKFTTINETWTNANPQGRLRRICDECGEGFAGG